MVEAPLASGSCGFFSQRTPYLSCKRERTKTESDAEKAINQLIPSSDMQALNLKTTSQYNPQARLMDSACIRRTLSVITTVRCPSKAGTSMHHNFLDERVDHLERSDLDSQHKFRLDHSGS